jgi:hypothetical protein
MTRLVERNRCWDYVEAEIGDYSATHSENSSKREEWIPNSSQLD